MAYKLFDNNIRQLNIGDTQGTLFNTFNCDLSFIPGKMCIAQRTRITTDTSADLDVSVGFVYFDGYWWTVSGLYVWKSTSIQGTFARDASNGGTFTTPSDCDSKYSDIAVFNGVLIVSTQSRIYRKAANGSGTGGWDVIAGSLSNAVTRNMCVYGKRLYWVNLDYTVHSCDVAYAVSTTSDSAYNITLPINMKITFLRAAPTGIYMGTTMTDGTEGYVIEWNGETKNTERYRYNVYAQGALAAYVDNTTFYMMNSDAELFQFTGSGFSFKARLPVRRDSLYNANATGSTGNDKFVHVNGMTMIDGKISLLINGTNNNDALSQMDNISSGIWEFNEDLNSLYHKYSMSYMTLGGSITDYGQIKLIKVGGLTNTPDLSNVSNTSKGNFLAGASFYKDATAVGYGIFTDNYYDTEEKAGFFSTVQIRASHFTEMWNKIALLYTPTTGFNFVVKYRTNRIASTTFTATWTSNTTFTTSQTGIVEGDEITVVQGTGGGRVAHVLSATYSNATMLWTITLDETITGATGTFKARVQKWKKIGTISNVLRFFQEELISQPGTLIEIKVAMRAIGEATIDELVLDNTKQQ